MSKYNPKIIVIVTSYNVSKYILKCLSTIKSQTYIKFKCYIIDDISTDNSVEKINNFIKGDNRFKLIVNKEKRYQCGNYDLICRDTPNIHNEDIVIEVDGDDYLPSNDIFLRVKHYYNNNDIWIANGKFILESGGICSSYPITNIDNIRFLPFNASHLRTWKVFLWRAMDINDLKDSNGNWWRAACDLIFMYDMLELSGLEHYQYMSEINYVYNDLNPISEGRVVVDYINNMIEFVKTKKPRKKLIRC